MTIDESEINRLRFEDLSQSLQDLINNLASYNDEDYITLRRHVSEISDNVDTSSTVYAGSEIPKMIAIGRTVYFSTPELAVKTADASGEWVYLS